MSSTENPLPPRKTIAANPVAVAALLLVPALLGLLLVSLATWGMRNGDYRSGVNLKMFGVALRMYADDRMGVRNYGPMLSSTPGRLLFDPSGFHPEYLGDPSILISPADPANSGARRGSKDAGFYFDNCSYDYIGYMVWDDATVTAFANAYRQRIRDRLPFDTDLSAAPPVSVVKRLDFGVYREMVPDDQRDKPEWAYLKHPEAEIPVLIERPHPYPGQYGLFLFGEVPLSNPVMAGCVLYMDGHAEFILYPGKWPMTRTTIETLEALRAAR